MNTNTLNRALVYAYATLLALWSAYMIFLIVIGSGSDEPAVVLIGLVGFLGLAVVVVPVAAAIAAIARLRTRPHASAVWAALTPGYFAAVAGLICIGYVAMGHPGALALPGAALAVFGSLTAVHVRCARNARPPRDALG